MDVTLAGEVLKARREQGLTQEALAERLGSTVLEVRAVEAGERVSRVFAERACQALSIPVARVLTALPDGWIRPVVPVDASHASTLARLRDAAYGPGWLVTPDVTGHDASNHWTEAKERRDRLTDCLMFACTLPFATLTAVAFVMLMLSILFILLGPVRFMVQEGAVPDVVPIVKFSAWCVGCFALGSLATLSILKAFVPSRRFLDLEKVGLRANWSKRPDMLSKAFLVTPDGISEFRISQGKVLRTDRPAGTFTAVDVVRDDDDHVTVRIDHIGLHEGDSTRTTMPWIPTSRDVDALVDTWRARVLTSPRRFGRSYVVPEAPRLVGKP